jgi:hypothetical protein
MFWDVLPCSYLNVDRRFRGACCLHHQGGDTVVRYESGSEDQRFALIPSSQLLAVHLGTVYDVTDYRQKVTLSYHINTAD